MEKPVAIALTIGVVALLVVLFFVTFVKYVKTPAPKGCEKWGRDESKCEDCKEESCRFYAIAEKYHEAKRAEEAAKANETQTKENVEPINSTPKGE